MSYNSRSKMSAICQNFVQNAWKKELCSNCFKSKDEHNQTTIKKPVPISSDKVIESIIKSSLKHNSKSKHTVSFTLELAEVIGYGGEDWSETDDDVKSDDENSTDETDVEFDGGEDDKELNKLTKANTDFNTVNANLLTDNTEMKKSYTHLKLGTPQIDAEGRKQTFLVSVTPYGQENTSLSMKKFTKTISHIPVAKNNKEIVIENKTNAVLTSYTAKNEDNIFKEEKSLLEEISETLEKSKTPIQIISRKKAQKDVVLTVSKMDNADKNKENEKEASVKTSSTYLLEKAAEKSTEKIKDLKSNNKSSIPERKNGITRAPVIKKDQEKPAIFQTSTAKIELLNNKNLKLNEETLVTNKPETNINKTDECDKKLIEDKESANKIEERIVESKDIVSNMESTIQKTNNINDNNTKLVQNGLEENKSVETPIKGNKSIISDKEIENKIETKTESSTDSETSEDSSTEAANSLTESLAGEQENSENAQVLDELKPVVVPPESREQAGEPDGHADPDGANEPPALPTTPPPVIETRPSFLHGTNDKPKLPMKPATVLIRKPVIATNQLIEAQTQQHTLTTFTVEAKTPEEQKLKLDKQDSYGSDIGRTTTNKRRAPKPPSLDESVVAPFCRNSSIGSNIDSPVIREKEKRERASSCSPKIRNEVNTNPNGIARISPAPEPAPRKLLSLSTDSLAGVGTEEKKKEKSKGRFSLKKFLRMSSSKDLQKAQVESPKYEEVKFVEPQPRPRLVIVHPLELNGAKVEVVSKPVSPHEQIDYSLGMSTHHSEYQVPRTISIDHSIYEHRSVKPPPPPRNLDDWNRRGKPNLPHPPKSAEVINKHKHLDKSHFIKKKNDSVYANIGEVRSAITPHKPQRTASMREREALAAQQQKRHPSDNYEPIDVSSKEAKENVYDYINGARSSSPDYSDSSPDKNSPTSKTTKVQRCLRQARSSSNVDVSGDYFKFQNIPRSASLTYCGSETESEIYSPYSFYGSESEVAEDDRDWTTHNGRTYKLRSRKGRSIVHKNLEDNYGAVVVANHEALAQVLENIQQGPPIQPALRGLKTASNLRWADFSVKENLPALAVGSRVFHQAVWGAHHVTIVISTGSTPPSSHSLGTFNLMPITEFTDLIPVRYLPINTAKDDMKLVQASIAVLPWMQINTIQTYTDLLKSKSSNSTQEELFKDACFIVLQLVNALKMLQAQGIEELPLSLTSFVICREMDKDSHHRLCVLQGLGEEIAHKKENIKFGSLCLCATTVLTHLLPNAKLTPLLRSLLNTERAVSLTQVKSILEFSLWGPSDVPLSTSIRERELALQRWLDLQRATVLHGLVCTRIQLTVYEECHLLFLVRSNAKMMCDASLLLDSSSKQNMLANGHK